MPIIFAVIAFPFGLALGAALVINLIAVFGLTVLVSPTRIVLRRSCLRASTQRSFLLHGHPPIHLLPFLTESLKLYIRSFTARPLAHVIPEPVAQPRRI